MIKISEDFECEERSHDWALYENYMGESKDGKEPKIQRKTSSHSSFAQICDVMTDRKIGKCESMEEVKLMLRKASAFELVRILDLPDIPKPSKRID